MFPSYFLVIERSSCSYVQTPRLETRGSRKPSREIDAELPGYEISAVNLRVGTQSLIGCIALAMLHQPPVASAAMLTPVERSSQPAISEAHMFCCEK